MEYQALYRKWRPSRFEDVFGQEHVTTTLKNQIMQEKIGHAYLFTGTRGTGKTTCAKILAKAVNCLSPVDGEPCGQCENCRLFELESLYDVVEIDAASKSRVEDIRSIIDEVVYTPSIGKRKVYIIDEVQMMTNNAFNALLKTLEEPPKHVVFILATTEAQKIPATILSRCQRFDFKRLSVSVITERLSQVAKQEGIKLESDAAEMIAILADGALRDALSILEQCQTASVITKDTVRETVGIADSREMLSLICACAAGNMTEAISILDGFYATSMRMDTLLSEMTGCYRDLLLVSMNAQDCVRRGKDEIKEFEKVSKTLASDYIFYCIDEISSAMANATKNSGNLTLAQMCVLQLCRYNKPVEVKPVQKPNECKQEPIKKVAVVKEKTDATFDQILSSIPKPNIRMFIPQKGKYENGNLYLYAETKAQYDLAMRPETQAQIQEVCKSMGLDSCVIHVSLLGEQDQPIETNDTFSL